MPPRTLSSLFGIGRREAENDDVVLWPEPSLKLEADKNVYRPGDLVTITVEIRNPPGESSLLLDKLSFEATGIEKLDTQWFNTHKPLPNNNSSDSSIHNRRRRGEYVFMDASVSSVVSNQLLSSGTTRTYILRMNLPTVIPPSYRGSTVRYLYHVKSVLSGIYLNTNDGRPRHQLPAIEARLPLQIWVTEKTNGLLNEETESNGIVPATPILLDVYWKDMDAESEWARANETFDGVEEDYESQRDDVSSVSSYKPARASLQKVFGSQLSLQSSSKDVPYNDQKSTASSYMALPQVSGAEVLYGSSEDILSARRSSAIVSSNQQPSSRSLSMEDDSKSSSVTKTADPVASEGFIRGRKSYNIRLDDQVLLRFSPTKPESTYYFGDMIGGALTFFHEEGSRRCLELSVTLELSETISRRSAHPSRRHSPTITKIQSDHHEVVADLVQTSFLFSVPMDGPMSFSTRHVSVQWVLRFEFFITPKNVDWTRYEHPLLIEGRDKFEWVLPITVHAPPFTTTVSHSRTEKPASIEPLWDRP